jgi:enoyl-[acyl-carrier protein] reductase II
VQVGTRFVVATESNAHQSYKEKVLKAKDIDTTVSASIVGHPVRAIKNKLSSAYAAARRKISWQVKFRQMLLKLGAGAPQCSC